MSFQEWWDFYLVNGAERTALQLNSTDEMKRIMEQCWDRGQQEAYADVFRSAEAHREEVIEAETQRVKNFRSLL